MSRSLSRVLLLALALLAGTPLAAAPQHFLWRVTGTTGHTLYLAGSVHVLRPGDAALPAAYDTAWAATGALMLEIDFAATDPAALQAEMLARGTLSRARRLDDVLSPRGYREFVRRARALDLRVSAMRPFEPWFAALSALSEVMRRNGLDESLGVDHQLAERAAREGRPVTGLETVAEQLAVFDGLSSSLQERFLLDTLSQLKRLDQTVDGLIAAWRAGDLARMEDLQTRGLRPVPEFYDALIVRRNTAWVTRLEERLRSGPDTLVVVGAQHLVGPDAVQEMLRARGHTVERL